MQENRFAGRAASSGFDALERMILERVQRSCSIRINDQWRFCFVWNDGVEDLELVDDHA